MATNPYVNKVTYSGTTLIDLTSDTVEAGKMLSPYTAHDKSGVSIFGVSGTYAGQSVTYTETDNTSGGYTVDIVVTG